MGEGNKISRRKILQLGLGAGAGLALWEMYKLAWTNKHARNQAASLLYKNTGLDDTQLARLLSIALENKGRYADIFLEYSMGTSLNFDGDRLLHAGVESVSGAGVR